MLLRDFKAYFDPLFESYLTERVAVLPRTNYFFSLGRHLRELAGGGKRLRPFLALTAYERQGAKEFERLLPLLYALEFYHLFALIHDDIIDQATTRHDVPCLHHHFNRNQAILAGDLCLTWAYEALHSGHYEDSILTTFSHLAQETMAGQMLDVALATVEIPTEKLAQEIIEYKTARYTFIYPLMLGAFLAEDHTLVSHYVTIGRLLGHVFQRLDDLADLLWEAPQLGKEPGTDIRQGLPTSVWLKGYQAASTKEQVILNGYFGNKLLEIETIRTIFLHHGVIAEEVEALKNMLAEAEWSLEAIPLSELASSRWTHCLESLHHKLNSFAEIQASVVVPDVLVPNPVPAL